MFGILLGDTFVTHGGALQGTLTPQLGLLSELRYLDLRGLGLQVGPSPAHMPVCVCVCVPMIMGVLLNNRAGALESHAAAHMCPATVGPMQSAAPAESCFRFCREPYHALASG